MTNVYFKYFTILNKRTMIIKAILIIALYFFSFTIVPRVDAQDISNDLSAECANLANYADYNLMKMKPNKNLDLGIIGKPNFPVDISIPLLTFQEKVYDKKSVNFLSERDRDVFFPTFSTTPYLKFFTNKDSTNLLPSLILHQLQLIPVNYNDKKPHIIKLSLNYLDPKTFELVKKEFKETSQGMFEVPFVEPERCYLLEMFVTGFEPGTSKIFNALYMDLVKVEEP